MTTESGNPESSFLLALFFAAVFTGDLVVIDYFATTLVLVLGAIFLDGVLTGMVIVI